MRDVGDHFGDDIEEDGDCVPTCVFTVLDMDIAKDFSVEVVVVKMKNCHFETSLVFSKKLWTVIYLQTEYVSTKNTEKKNYQTRTIYRQLPEVRGGGPRNVLQQTRGRAQAGAGPPFICSPLETLTT